MAMMDIELARAYTYMNEIPSIVQVWDLLDTERLNN